MANFSNKSHKGSGSKFDAPDNRGGVTAKNFFGGKSRRTPVKTGMGDSIDGRRDGRDVGYAAGRDSGLRSVTVNVGRKAKVVKGGRIFRFSAIVVVGDGNGRMGIGKGKAREVSQAIHKATEDGKKNMIKVDLKNTTIPHTVIGRHCATKVVIMPATEGAGLIAGGAMRSIFDVLGVRDVLSKCIGSRTPSNVVAAAVDALKKLVTPQKIANKRGLNIKEIVENYE